jgi:putative transposase
MNHIYSSVGMSKQNFHQRLDYQMNVEMEKHELLSMVFKVRWDHPRMSARKMYTLIDPVFLGRDKFEELCFSNGYRLERKRSYQRTTNSLGVTRFENHLSTIKLTGINQAFVSDITYYRIEEKFYYLTFIMDLFSRQILGYSASSNLLTENTTIPALKMAIRERNGVPKGIIMHSDGGGQYYCKEFRKLTENNKMVNSMADNVYENANAERLNGTIKNEYLTPYGPKCLKSLSRMLKKAVKLYNEERPHQALNGRSPVQFEKELSTN